MSKKSSITIALIVVALFLAGGSFFYLKQYKYNAQIISSQRPDVAEAILALKRKQSEKKCLRSLDQCASTSGYR